MIVALSIALVILVACGGSGHSATPTESPATTQQPIASPADTNTSAQPSVSEQGFIISGAVSADITWEQDFLPNCYATTADDGAQAFFFGVVSPKEYQLYASIHPFRGAGSYDAAAAPSQIGRFDWRTAAVTVFKLGNDESERWLATAGSFTVERSDDDGAAGSLDADLAPAGADAKGPIHVTGSWTCRHTGD